MEPSDKRQYASREPPQKRRVGKGGIAKDGLGVMAVFGGHVIVIGEHRIRLNLVVSGVLRYALQPSD